MSNIAQELEQDPFDPEEFVERVAWRCTSAAGIKLESDDFDPLLLHSAFVQTIRDLKALNEVTQQKLDRFRSILNEEEKKNWKNVSLILGKNKAAVNKFQELEQRINYVATKVVHLGDELESVNTPRARAVEAQKLMNYFAEFLSDGPVISEIFTDSTQLYQAADVIHKLLLITQELPADKFEKARNGITQMYDQIERKLIEEFSKAYTTNNKVRMKEIAGILSHFKGYSQCVDVFIEESQLEGFVQKDIFADVIPLCEKNAHIIQEVFTNPEQVMSKFILNIYYGKLQEYIKSRLSDTLDLERYLKTLYDLYAKTNKLSNDLYAFNMGNDRYFLGKLTKNIFQRYLDTYISTETSYLKEKNSSILQRYYESKNHQKKQIQSGGIYDLKRNLQVSLVSKANIHIGTAVETYGGETFVSEEVAINLLQEVKLALRRCQLLSKQSDLPENAVQILDILILYLCIEHIDYAVELALQSIPLPEPKSPPELYFLDVLRQCNAIMHLLEKQFNDNFVPMVISTTKHADCLQKKKSIVEQLEQKLDTGLDRVLTAIVGWTKYLLQFEQKKTDFKPESEDVIVKEATPACTKVVKFLKLCAEKIRDCLDGKNVELTLLELGTRFHRVVYEHLQQFQYNSLGAVYVMYDINEYKECVQDFKIPLLNSLFETLYVLCNLLVVKPANLKQVCLEDQLASLDKTVILNFVQLRADYKTAKLFNQLK